MTIACRTERFHARRVVLPRPQRPNRSAGWRWLWLAVGLLLGGYLLFAHGCHGDEDNELLANTRSPQHRQGILAGAAGAQGNESEAASRDRG